ncbi:hypothetical protein IMZ31_19860 (plasmid) [Pontibacillus sp. ALD_SL1]|uniref:hypothetical protein n=1 Tax=Pontibacillus sp. ALD_SL1 TaxID=2777185 RepID=UPI001A9686FB|nr:hypothetical protein [Pontibacillus sp. ALD_SL1]QST02808.1 hypothetical protein IMZ31_19860 [Pontibacillus sp. ALD_SL1]
MNTKQLVQKMKEANITLKDLEQTYKETITPYQWTPLTFPSYNVVVGVGGEEQEMKSFRERFKDTLGADMSDSVTFSDIFEYEAYIENVNESTWTPSEFQETDDLRRIWYRERAVEMRIISEAKARCTTCEDSYTAKTFQFFLRIESELQPLCLGCLKGLESPLYTRLLRDRSLLQGFYLLLKGKESLSFTVNGSSYKEKGGLYWKDEEMITPFEIYEAIAVYIDNEKNKEQKGA